MKNLFLLFVSLLLLGASYQSSGQSACLPNIDFETGTTNVWAYYIGSCCSGAGTVTGLTVSAPIANRHRVTSGSGTDYFGGFPIVAPGGGSYSLKLGNSGVNYQAERARYYVHVPTGVSSFGLIYRFAVVLEDPGHTPDIQPRFEVNATDSASGAPITGGTYSYIAGGTLPGFYASSLASDVMCLPWTDASIDLSGTAGQTIIVDFTSADCGAGGHFGYGYLEMTCGLFGISTTSCDTASITLGSPPGYAHYSWFDSSTFASVLDTNRTVTFALPSAPITYAVIITPYSGYGITDTLYRRIVPSHLRLHRSNDTVVCAGTPVTINTGATDIATPLTYTWSPSSTLSCATCSATVATPMTTTPYYFTVTNANGCEASDTITITTLHSVGAITGTSVLCIGGAVTLSDTTSGGRWSSSNAAIATIDSVTGVVTAVAAGIDTVFYTVTSSACGTIAASAIIAVAPTPVAGTISGLSAICTGAFTILTSSGSSGGAWSSSDTSVVTVSSSGIVAGVGSGIATISYIVSGPCGTDTALYVLYDSLSLSAGSLSGGSSMCVGATVTLTPSVTGGIWSATNANATVSGGIVTGINPGLDTIMYTISSSCGWAFASLIVTVIGAPSPGTISGSTSVCIGNTIMLMETVSGGSWSTGSTATASISGGGIVYGLGVGTAIVSYTVTGACGSSVATYSISVISVPAAGTITGADSVCEGYSTTFTESVAGGSWTSSDATVATVASSGMVTGVSNGSVVITYTTTNMCGSSSTMHSLFVRAASDCVSGLNSIVNDVSGWISIYPNPNRGAFSIDMPYQVDDVVITVLDVPGKVILTKTITDRNLLHIPVNIGNVAPGIYMVKVQAGNVTYRRKVVVL